MHPKSSNDSVPPPPTFVLPSPAQVARALSTRREVWRADARAHFFQVPLPHGLAGAFRLVVEEGEMVLTRLPMGARMSPVVGDAVSRWFADVGEDEQWEGEVECYVYIDDFLFLTRSRWEAFASKVARWGLELGVAERCAERVVFIGVEADLPGGRFRAGEKVARKTAAALRAALEEGTSLEEYESMVGRSLSFLERDGRALTTAAELVRGLVRRSAQGGGKTELSTAERAAAHEVKKLAESRRWRRWVRRTRVVYAATDASLTGWGVVMEVGGETWWRAGVWKGENERIQFLELRAVGEAVRLAPPGVELRVHSDNANVVGWVTRGLARPQLASRLLARVEADLERKGIALKVQYIPSAVNPADALSRGEALNPAWTLPRWRSETQRRIMGEFVDAGGDGDEEGTEPALGGASSLPGVWKGAGGQRE